MDYSVAKASKGGVKVSQPEIIGDIRYGIPIPDHSVNLIYTIHTFEHLVLTDLIKVLQLCRNKLKVGGLVRIVVPDFDEMIKDYLNQAPVKQDIWEIKPNFPIGTPTELFIARIMYPDHKYLLNFEILNSLLMKTGYVDIKKCKPGETSQQNLENIFLKKEINRVGDIIIEALNPSLSNSKIEKRYSSLLNLKLSRVNDQLPRFPELNWFKEKYLKTRKINLVYWNKGVQS
jgi:predicted SAM-dependent methyltransferase